MLNNANSYIRARGFLLISANVKWDEDCKIDEIIDEYLTHISDTKPIIARQCIKALPNLAKYKPELKNDIITALHRIDISIYSDSMQSLVCKDVRESLAKVNGEK